MAKKPSIKHREPKSKHEGKSPRTKLAFCYCYMLECSDGTFYTGWTTDAERRLKVHNAGRGARYTSARRPVRLVYLETQPDRTTAMKRERAIKRLTRQKKQALILTFHPSPAE